MAGAAILINTATPSATGSNVSASDTEKLQQLKGGALRVASSRTGARRRYTVYIYECIIYKLWFTYGMVVLMLLHFNIHKYCHTMTVGGYLALAIVFLAFFPAKASNSLINKEDTSTTKKNNDKGSITHHISGKTFHKISCRCLPFLCSREPRDVDKPIVSANQDHTVKEKNENVPPIDKCEVYSPPKREQIQPSNSK